MREREFLDYNIKNILENFIQAEDHARYVTGEHKPEHVACIRKHYLMIRGEAKEGISHSSVAKPEWVGIFKKTLKNAEEFLEKLEKDWESIKPKLINIIRSHRKEFEKSFPMYDTEKCETCGTKLGEVVERLKAFGVALREKYLKGENKNINMAEMVWGRPLGKLVVGQVVGNLEDDYLEKYISELEAVPEEWKKYLPLLIELGQAGGAIWYSRRATGVVRDIVDIVAIAGIVGAVKRGIELTRAPPTPPAPAVVRVAPRVVRPTPTPARPTRVTRVELP